MDLRRKRLPEPADREVLAGLVEQVSYHDPDNGFCVLRVKTVWNDRLAIVSSS